MSSAGSAYLQALLRHTAADARITAAYVGGPLVMERPDRFPELDLYLIAPAGFAAELPAWLAPLGDAAHLDVTPGGCSLVTTDGLAVAVHVIPGTAALPKQGVKPVFDRGAEPGEAVAGLSLEPARFWHHLYLLGAAIGRGQPFTAHGELEACRLELLNLYRLALTPGAAGSGWTRIEDLPGAGRIIEGMTEWLVSPLEIWALWRCAHKLSTTYESLVLPLAERLGLDYPWAMRNLAFERLAREKPDRVAQAEEIARASARVQAAPEPTSAPSQPAGPAKFRIKRRSAD